MAEKKLLDVAPQERTSEAEVEQFKMERSAEKEFLRMLVELVAVFVLKVSQRNRMLLSIQRFIRNQK